MMGYRGGYGYGYNMMPWGGFFWLIVLVLIIAIAVTVFLITTDRRRNVSSSFNNNSIEILKQRYARGEINEEQYRKMRDAIEK